MTKNAQKLTSEEKLLHVIEKPDNIDKLNLPKKGRLTKSGKAFSLFKKMDFKKISLRSVNKALLCVSVIVTIAFASYFIHKERVLRVRFVNLKERAGKEVFHLTAKDQIPKISAYLGESQKNNPFDVLPVAKKAVAEKNEEERINLKLVGIIWSDKPQAIIEDDVAEHSYMVYEGEKIDKFTVKEITPNNVTLTSKDGEKILK